VQQPAILFESQLHIRSPQNRLNDRKAASLKLMANPFVSIAGARTYPVTGLDPEALAVAKLGASALVKSLSNRTLSRKNPCGDAVEQSREELRSSTGQRNNRI
jgi:hypothetical protein